MPQLWLAPVATAPPGAALSSGLPAPPAGGDWSGGGLTGCVSTLAVGVGGGFTTTGAGGAGTVIAALPVSPSLDAVIVTAPAPMAVIWPAGLTDTTDGLLEVHCMARSCNTPPRASRSAALSCAVLPTASVRVAGDTATAATGTALTV